MSKHFLCFILKKYYGVKKGVVYRQIYFLKLQVIVVDCIGRHRGALSYITVKINRQAGVNGIGKYCGQYGLSKGIEMRNS